MPLTDIVGQINPQKILGNVLRTSAVPTSYLFFGPEGVGKKFTALKLAQALNCLSLENQGCDHCNSCRKIMEGNHPDILLISPEDSSIDIEQIRELKSWSGFKPYEGKKRVIILEKANKLTKGAANAFLKLLEEPPPNTHMILICENIQNILPTIISRCQNIKFNPLTEKDLEKILSDKFRMDPEEAHRKSVLARGSLTRALNSDLKGKENFSGNNLFFLEKNFSEEKIIDYVKGMKENNREEIVEFLNNLLLIIRDLNLLKITQNKNNIINPVFAGELNNLSADYSIPSLLSIFAVIQESIKMIQYQNTNPQLTLEVLFMKIKSYRNGEI